MTIKKVIEDLNKNVKVYESKKEDKDKPKIHLDSSKFSDEQRKLENELLRHRSEKDKGVEKALESIVANGQITTTKNFEEFEKQHFEKQFEKVKFEYKTHDVNNLHAKEQENANDAYDSGHTHKEEHMHNHYNSGGQKSVYRNNDSGY